MRVAKTAAGRYVVLNHTYEAWHYTELGASRYLVPTTQWIPQILLGHNINFDLLWMRADEIEVAPSLSLREWAALGGRVMDTQYIEYLLSGQRHLYAKLDDLIVKYLGKSHMKDDAIKKYWDAGVDTEDIPKHKLMSYMKNDVLCTAKIFVTQYEVIENAYPELWNLVDAHAAALYAYNEIEWNGMYLDTAKFRVSKEKLADRRIELHKDLHRVALRLLDEAADVVGMPTGNFCYRKATSKSIASLPEFKPMAPRTVSAILFGGAVGTFKDKELVGKYKNGNDKYKTREVFLYTQGVIRICDSKAFNATFPISTAKLKAGTLGAAYPLRSTDTATLEALAVEVNNFTFTLLTFSAPQQKLILEFIDIVLALRGIDKEWGSYFETIPKLLTPQGVIHHKLNTTASKTGRLSSSQINMQNIPSAGEGSLKSSFTSRFKGGVVGEADYESLEFRGMGYTTGDSKMYETLNSGSDVHYETGKTAFGYTCKADETKEKRRDTKGGVFGTVFGGGAPTIARQTGIPKPMVLKIQEAFKKTYHEMYEVQKEFFEAANEALHDYARTGTASPKWNIRKVPGAVTDKGRAVFQLTTQQTTGRLLTYRSYDAPTWSKKNTISFSPTEMKNYPVN